jgi:hypothetical protein
MRVFFFALCVVALANSSVYAYLGGFEIPDGYFPIGIQQISYDVATYNAGQYGTRFGGVVYTPDASDATVSPTELWTRIQGAPNQNSLAGLSSSPFSYATGHVTFDRSYINAGGIANGPLPSGTLPGRRVNQALVITTNSQGWAGVPREYSYQLDNHDLNGAAAIGQPSIPMSSASNSKMLISWWSCAQIFGTGDTPSGGLGVDTRGDKISFYDSAGTLGFEVGYIQPGTTLDNAWYRAGNTGATGAGTSIPITLNKYHRWDIELDMLANTVKASLFDPFVGSGTTYTVIPAGTPTVGNMADLATLGFTSTAGVNNDKKWSVDDFQFCVTEAALSELLDGGTLWSGDKQFSEFEYHGGGDMPAAEDVFVKAITDADGNVGIRFQGAFVDAAGGGASDALIDFLVTAPEGKLIKDVHMAANPLVVGGGNTAGLVSVTETFLADNDQTVLSVFDLKPGSRKLTDWADLVDADGNLAPVQQLHVQKDIIAWAQQLGSAATMSFIDQTFSQCDADPANSGVCRVVDPPMGHPGDFNGDGMVNAADYSVWRNGLGSIYTQADYEIWKAHFGESWPPGSSATSSVAVPEPTSWAMAGVCLATLLFWQGRSTLLSHELRQYPPPATPV